jgi:putative ABC transport system permease protein
MKSFIRWKKEYFNAVRVGWFLALRQIRRSGKGTTALIIFIMVLTFLNLVVVSGLLLGLISGSFIQFRDSYSGEVIVTAADGRDYIEGSPQLINYLEHNPVVKAISPRYSVGATVLGTLNDLPAKNERPNQIAMSVVGINPDREEVLTHFSRFVTYGKSLDSAQEGYILVGANLLKKYSSFADANIPGLDLLKDVDIGSRVRVSIPAKDGGTPVSKDFIVKGIIKSKVDQVSTRFFVNDTDLKRLLSVNQNQVQEIAISTDYAQAQDLVDDIKNFMGTNVARVQTYDQAIPSFLRDIETTMGVLGNALSSIALVVATITIFIVVFINAVTKRKFIGIMKGIGISPFAIQFSYVLQAFFYGAVGSLIGSALTFGVLKPYFSAHPINFPFSDGILVVTAYGAAIRVAILIVVTLLAGYVPAKIIVRRNTLDAILGR